MRAAVLHAPRDLRIEEVPKPQVRAGEVLLRVRATAICGTDVGIYIGKEKTNYPRIQGHESTGEIVEIGEGVRDLSVGERVVINPAVFCRDCFFCHYGTTNLCNQGGLFGREFDGSFAEYVRVPAYSVHKLPEEISFIDGTSLNVLATVLRAHDRFAVKPGDLVAVVGQGVAGLLHTRVAKLRGASKVIGISRSQWKLDLARQFGADEVAGAGGSDAVKQVMEITGGRGVDVVIESVGKGDTLRESMEMVRPGGVVVAFGVGAKSIPDFPHYLMYYKELDLVGSRGMRPVDYENGIRLCANGQIDLKPLVTEVLPLEKLKDGMETMVSNPGKALRIVINI
ncbi:MAG TPA: alcohol dehydrogenase catalytic domain-containing protein [Firmicutes bacterium]|nr:alcohol dehydrogenase catalytic domain-containing protein [Bacillota bacterium]